MAVDIESAIQIFLRGARTLQSEPGLTAEAVLQWVINDFSNVRIDGATFDADGDMLLLQWGAIDLLKIDTPTDLRKASDDDIAFEESEQQYIDFTRQLFVEGDDEDAEFDDSAIQLSMTLAYGRATGDEPSSNQWIDNPSSIEKEVEKFRSVPFVRKLLGQKVSKLVATVEYCG